MTSDSSQNPEPTDRPEHGRRPHSSDPSDLPPAPSIWSFAERGPGRLALESLLGGTAGFLLSGALSLEELRWSFAVAGAIAAPIALMLTPVKGGVTYRALRYGGALAVLLTLVVSFAGEGRERPLDELLVWGVLFFILGTVAHGLMALSLDREVVGEE